MKTIFFTLKPPVGSYGGGAFFVKNMSKFLTENGFRVVFDLIPNIDIIFIIDPRRDKYNRYSIDDIIKYKWKNPSVKIIHRVNECDIKREHTINIEPLLLKTMSIADHVVFISKWLQEYFINKYSLKLKKTNYILNGCNREEFYPIKKNINNRIKLVTHHWSNNYLKGFEIYNKLDQILPTLNIEFIFIGNYNKKYNPKNIKMILPTSGKQLGDIIRNCDIYITATQNEPCGMHHLEGLSCGLPILYRSGGGAIKEVCKNVGEEFTDIKTLLEKLELIKNNYNQYRENIQYGYLGSNRCSMEYYELINSL